MQFADKRLPPGAHAVISPAPEQNSHSVTARVLLFIAIVSIALVALEAWSRSSAREDALSQSRIATANTARASAENVQNTFDVVDSIVWGLVERVTNDGIDAASRSRLHALAQATVGRSVELHGVYIYDQHGRVAADSWESRHPDDSLAGQDGLAFHREHANGKVYIGHPIRSRAAGVWVLPVSRRIDDPYGRFAGMALATIDVAHFQTEQAAYRIGKQGSIMLAMDDGTLVTRKPLKDGMIGSTVHYGSSLSALRHWPSGTAMLVSELDQVERVYSYQRLQSYPLIVITGLAKDEILGQWFLSTLIETAAITVLLAIIFGTGSNMLGQVVLRDRMEQALRISQTELEARNRTLKSLATQDPLTGLSNRRHLDERMAVEFARAARENTPLAMIMIDVDHFKLYNDSYGHAAGDTCLQAIAGVIAAACRHAADMAARFGGEEFALLLPGTDIEGALDVAQRACAAIHATALVHGGSPFGVVTASAGVFALVPTPGQPLRTLIECADRGLYSAKAAGRNQVKAGDFRG
jgi:diguanylate cyclase (GGDEF)-like protein